MLHTVFIDALPPEDEVEVRTLGSRDKIGLDNIIKAVQERCTLSVNKNKGSDAGQVKGPNQGRAMYAGDGAGGGHGAGRFRGRGTYGRGSKKKAPTKTVVAPPVVVEPPRTVVVRARLPEVMASASKPPKEKPTRGCFKFG